MIIEELIVRLESLAEAAPGGTVMLRRGDGNWFDEIEDVGICSINPERDGLDCGSGDPAGGASKEVIVIG